MKKLRVTVDGKAYEVLVEVLDSGPNAAGGTTSVSSAPAPLATLSPTLNSELRTLNSDKAAPCAAAPTRNQKLETENSAAAAVPPGGSTITSPLSGKVVSIDVAIGDTVAAGAKVAVVEAMKMNTDITATAAGKVLSIHATAGESIEEGAIMINLG